MLREGGGFINGLYYNGEGSISSSSPCRRRPPARRRHRVTPPNNRAPRHTDPTLPNDLAPDSPIRPAVPIRMTGRYAGRSAPNRFSTRGARRFDESPRSSHAANRHHGLRTGQRIAGILPGKHRRGEGYGQVAPSARDSAGGLCDHRPPVSCRRVLSRPHAACISSPREARIVVGKPLAASASRNRSIAARSGEK